MQPAHGNDAIGHASCSLRFSKTLPLREVARRTANAPGKAHGLLRADVIPTELLQRLANHLLLGDSRADGPFPQPKSKIVWDAKRYCIAHLAQLSASELARQTNGLLAAMGFAPSSTKPWLEAGIDGLALQGKHAKYALVHAPERLTSNKPLQPLDTKRELT